MTDHETKEGNRMQDSGAEATRPSSQWTVRRAEVQDAPTLVAFQLAMAEETEGLSLDRPTVEAGVQAVFQDPAKGSYWLAASPSGELVGCLMVTSEWSDWRNGTVLWIQSVYVAPAGRGRGVFRSLYQHLRWLVESDSALRGLRLYVDQRNTSAQKVYEALGMSREHYLMYEWLA